MKYTKAALTIIVFWAAGTFALPTAAQQGAVYVGGSLGQSRASSFCGGAATCDDKQTAGKLFAGYQLNRNFAAEAGYGYLGKFTADGAGITSSVWELVGIGAVPLSNQFSVYGKLGAYYATTKSAPFKRSNRDLTYGLGGQYGVSRNIALRGEWQHYNDVGGGVVREMDINVLWGSLLWSFQ